MLCRWKKYLLGLFQWFFWTCFCFNGGKQPIWSIFSRRSFTLVPGTLSTYLTNLRHIFYILFFLVCLICKFYIYRNFICYSDFYFIVMGWTINRNYLVKGRKCFYQDLATLQIWFWSGKRFSTEGLKNSLSNQDLVNGQLRAGFESRKVSHMNIHSRSDLKYITFNTGTQSVLDL